jgi:hypothetical protein
MDAPTAQTPPPASSPYTPSTPQPRRKTDRKEWDTPIWQHINDLRYIKPCKKPEEIHQLTGVPRQAVINICERDEHLLRRARPKRAPEYKVSREKVLEIGADMDGFWGHSSMTMEELINFYHLDCCPQTLLNSFCREGIGHF